MITSDDSLFEEMTKQMENTHPNANGKNTNISDNNAEPNNNKNAVGSSEKLPDLIEQKKDAITSLLLLGAGADHKINDILDNKIDADVNNEEVLPVDAPKLPDFTKDMREAENTENTIHTRKQTTNKAHGEPKSRPTKKKKDLTRHRLKLHRHA